MEEARASANEVAESVSSAMVGQKTGDDASGFKVWRLNDIDNIFSFLFKSGELCLFKSKVKEIDSKGLKQITIPLPPKADKQELSEWPEVGDEVQTSTGKGTVKLPPDEHGFYIILINGEYSTATIGQMQKPKTPEEELRDLLHELWHANGGDFDDFVDVAIDHITKKV